MLPMQLFDFQLYVRLMSPRLQSSARQNINSAKLAGQYTDDIYPRLIDTARR